MLNTEEHDGIRQVVRDFVDNEVNPHVEEWEKAGIFPAHELFKKAGALDLLGITKPEKYGGLGLDYTFAIAYAEELGRARCGSIPMAMGVQSDMATPALARFGSEELCEQFLVPAIKGEMVACLGVSEPGAGSDVASIKTTARKDGDDYVINGTKMWITNATQADWCCLLANTGDGPVHQNKTLIVLPMDTPGITISPKLDKLGMRSSDTAQLFFEDVRVPQRHRIGEEGKGFQYQMMQFQEERLYAAASGLKGLEWVIEETIAYTRQRIAFGKPILANQTVHFKLAELATRVELLRSLVYRAGLEYREGADVTKLASMAKLEVGRLSRELTDACLQFWGGMGFMWDNDVSRAYRDTRLVSIGAGADEVMLGIICKLMGMMR